MNIYHFTAYLGGVSEFNDDDVERLFEAGCDDATPSSRTGIARVGFDRESDCLDNAIRSAIADVTRAGFHVERIELESDDLEELARAPASQRA